MFENPDGQEIYFSGKPQKIPPITGMKLQERYPGEGADRFDIAAGKEDRTASSMYYLRKVQAVEDKIHDLQQSIEGLEINLGGQAEGVGGSIMADEKKANSIRRKMQALLDELPNLTRELDRRKRLYESESGEKYTGHGGGKRRKGSKRKGSKRKGSRRRRRGYRTRKR